MKKPMKPLPPPSDLPLPPCPDYRLDHFHPFLSLSNLDTNLSAFVFSSCLETSIFHFLFTENCVKLTTLNVNYLKMNGVISILEWFNFESPEGSDMRGRSGSGYGRYGQFEVVHSSGGQSISQSLHSFVRQ